MTPGITSITNHKSENDYFNLLKKGKRKEIYDLIEEPIEPEIILIKESKKIVKTKKLKNKNTKLFEGRNIIKKVKTYCLKIFYKKIKECTEIEKMSSKFRLKIHEKKNVYRIFKSDISKFRNKILEKISMRKIMKIFSNININENTKIKQDKTFLFDFLMNSTWSDFLMYVKKGNYEITGIVTNKKNNKKNKKEEIILAKEINDYVQYIKNGTNSYKDRINLDKSYLKLYENLNKEIKIENVEHKEKNELNLNLNFEVQELIRNYKI